MNYEYYGSYLWDRSFVECKRLNYFKYSLFLLGFQNNTTLMVIIASIVSCLSSSLPSIDFAFATSEEGENTGGGDDNGGDNGGGGGDEPNPEP
jgi:hypothetical protein